jgi:hypothetical protein
VFVPRAAQRGVREMKKIRDWFWILFGMALLIGVPSGLVIEYFYRFHTTDWAAKGQPVLERFLDRQVWFLSGFLPGAIVGIIIGIFLLWRIHIDEKQRSL